MSSPDRDNFAAEELARVISRYDLGIIDDILEYKRGSRKSPKLYISTEHGKFLLKRRARGKNSSRRVHVAHQLQQHLAAHEFPVPQIAPSRPDRETLLKIDEQIYEMFEYVNGHDYDNSLGETFEAGRVLGQFHKLAADFPCDSPPPRDSFHDANAVRTGLNAIPSTISSHDSVAGFEADLSLKTNELYDAYDAAAEAAARTGACSSQFQQIVHSDWHPGNLLFRDGKVAAVVDFDSIRVAPRATDLANGALQFSIVGEGDDPSQWPDFFDETRLKRFLLGYDQTNAVTRGEMKGLVPLMIEALIAEAVVPIAATGSFGRMQGFGFLRMVHRKVRWLQKHAERLTAVLTG